MGGVLKRDCGGYISNFALHPPMSGRFVSNFTPFYDHSSLYGVRDQQGGQRLTDRLVGGLGVSYGGGHCTVLAALLWPVAAVSQRS